MRNKIVAGNWKMNNTLEEGISLASEIVNMVADELTDDVKMILCTPALHLSSVSKVIGNSEKVFLGAAASLQTKNGPESGAVFLPRRVAPKIARTRQAQTSCRDLPRKPSHCGQAPSAEFLSLSQVYSALWP